MLSDMFRLVRVGGGSRLFVCWQRCMTHQCGIDTTGESSIFRYFFSIGKYGCCMGFDKTSV